MTQVMHVKVLNFSPLNGCFKTFTEILIRPKAMSHLWIFWQKNKIIASASIFWDKL